MGTYGSDTRDLVSGQGHSSTGPAQQDGSVKGSPLDRLRHRLGDFWIVRGSLVVHTEVHYLVAVFSR